VGEDSIIYRKFLEELRKIIIYIYHEQGMQLTLNVSTCLMESGNAKYYSRTVLRNN
jgi:hypothetical protein